MIERIQDLPENVLGFMDWERIAVVTDVEWIRTAIKVFGFAMPVAGMYLFQQRVCQGTAMAE